ncbi:MAG: hypothetical protein ACRDYE_09395 [Acidimicrobiales bacterium]
MAGPVGPVVVVPATPGEGVEETVVGPAGVGVGPVVVEVVACTGAVVAGGLPPGGAVPCVGTEVGVVGTEVGFVGAAGVAGVDTVGLVVGVTGTVVGGPGAATSLVRCD